MMRDILKFGFLITIMAGCHMDVPLVVIDFSAEPDKGVVRFKNNTTGAESFVWDFGDGSVVSTEKDPTHTYASSKNYTVRLVAKGNGGTVGGEKIISVDLNVAAVNTFEKVWEFSYGGNQFDQFRAGVATNDGGAILAGTSASNPTNGANDMKIIRVNSSGDQLWEVNFGGAGDDGGSCIAEVAGGYLVGGYSNSDKGAGKDAIRHGDYDFWVVKIDGNGKKIWDKSYGGDHQDMLNAILPVPDGFLLGGFSRSDISGLKSTRSLGDADFYLVKIDLDGNQKVDRTYGGRSDDRINSMTLAPNNVVVLGGYSASEKNDVTKGTAPRGHYDYWVLKVNLNGDRIADYTFGGTQEDQVYAVAYDGRYYAAGESFSRDGRDAVTAPYLGQSDFYVCKFDDTGAKSWDRTYGGNNIDKLNALIPTPDGNLLLAGESSSPAGEYKRSTTYGKNDGWVLKVDKDGAIVRDADYGGTGADGINCIIKLTDGSYLLAGDSDSPVSGNKVSAPRGNSDMWLVRIRDK